MKGYYLFAPVEPACVGPQSGVERKVRAQHQALAVVTLLHTGIQIAVPIQRQEELLQQFQRLSLIDEFLFQISLKIRIHILIKTA